MATKRITYAELENEMLIWLQGVLFRATEVTKAPTVPMMHETLKPENHTTVRFTGIVVNDESLKRTAYDGGRYGGYSWVPITIEIPETPAPAPDAPKEGLCGYVAFYQGKRVEVYAPTLYAAHKKVAEQLKVPAKKEHLISVTLCERADGSEVIHTATD